MVVGKSRMLSECWRTRSVPQSGAIDGAGQAVEDTWILNGMWPNRRDLHAAIKVCASTIN